MYREGQTDVGPDPEPIELMERFPLVSPATVSDPLHLHRKQWRPRVITCGDWSGACCTGVGCEVFMVKTDGSYRCVHLAWVTFLPHFPHLMVSSLMWFWSSSQHFGMIVHRSTPLPCVFPLLRSEIQVWSHGGPGSRKRWFEPSTEKGLLRTVDQGGILLWTSKKKSNVKQVFLQSWDISKTSAV